MATEERPMNENLKTVVYVGVAAAVVLGAVGASRWSVPRGAPVVEDDSGQKFFPDFTDPLAVTRLAITSFDEGKGELSEFEVVSGPKGWTIPSHESYPADAQRQVEEAAASVIDLVKLGLVSDNPADQELYGVIEPSRKLEQGAVGVGKRVSMQDSGGNRLAEFIIGKEDPDQPKLHFVRVPNQDRIYRVEVDTSKLSTRFQDWIEKDLLKLNSWDIKDVAIDGYSVDELNGVIVPGDKLHLTYNDRDAKWTMDGLSTGEELNTEKLNELKSSLDNLQIVDVRRKPSGLSRDLKREEGVTRQEMQEGVLSLREKGYFVTPEGQLVSNEGEVLVGTTEGVEYVLRFGGIAANSGGGDAGKKPSDADSPTGEDAPSEEESDADTNRYLFVMAQFNQDLIPKPEGVDVSDIEPEEPGAATQPDEESTEKEPEAEPAADGSDAADENTDGNAAGEGAAVDEAPNDAGSNEGADAGRDAESAGVPVRTVSYQAAGEEGDAESPAAPAEEGAKPTEEGGEPSEADAGEPGVSDAPAENAQQPADGDKPTEDDQPTDGEAPAEGEKPAAGAQPAVDDPAAKRAEAAAKKKAKEEADRKRDEYQQKVNKGKAREKELNDRFADWYYVISDSLFKKIRLSRADVLKAKSDDNAAGGETSTPTNDAASGPSTGSEKLLELKDPRELPGPLAP
jgi:hypothetical protein